MSELKVRTFAPMNRTVTAIHLTSKAVMKQVAEMEINRLKGEDIL